MNYLCKFVNSETQEPDYRYVQYFGDRHFFNEEWLKKNGRMYEFEIFEGVMIKMPKEETKRVQYIL